MIKYLSHFILVVTFFVCNAFVWAETNVAEKYGCKNLHEIQSGEDALQQLYDNLNTDCFAKIPEIELEKIWGIKVYDFDNPNGITKNMNNDEFMDYLGHWFFKGKMAEKVKAEFKFDESKNNRKYLKVYTYNSSEYMHNYNLIAYNDKFPKILPNPLVVCNDRKIITGTFFGQWIRHYKKVNYGIYSPLCKYFWKGEKNELEINVDYPKADNYPKSDNTVFTTGLFRSFTFSINAM
ncbi:MAG: hypothetical protein IKH45_06915 [Neisseriaceae bacterium]|nr:hypothetical protein [Neisseriaceae bacterium]